MPDIILSKLFWTAGRIFLSRQTCKRLLTVSYNWYGIRIVLDESADYAAQSLQGLSFLSVSGLERVTAGNFEIFLMNLSQQCTQLQHLKLSDTSFTSDIDESKCLKTFECLHKFKSLRYLDVSEMQQEPLECHEFLYFLKNHLINLAKCKNLEFLNLSNYLPQEVFEDDTAIYFLQDNFTSFLVDWMQFTHKTIQCILVKDGESRKAGFFRTDEKKVIGIFGSNKSERQKSLHVDNFFAKVDYMRNVIHSHYALNS